MINVTAIKLPESFDAYKKTTGEKSEFLEPVSKINIFVGSNNSGKSRFMRKLSFQNSYEIKSQNVDLEEIRSEISNFIQKVENNFERFHIVEVSHLHINQLKEMGLSIPNVLDTSEDSYISIRGLFTELANYKTVDSYTSQPDWRANINYEDKKYLGDVIRLGAARSLEYINKVPIYSESDNPKKVYIPTLRGLRSFDDKHTDYYLDRTRKDYFPHHNSGDLAHLENVERKRPEIFTGLTLYQKITDLLLGNNSDRKLISKYQEFISEKLFEGKSVALIPNQKEKVVIVKIGNEQERPIYDLGDGIQSAIILSFLPFVMQEQTFFFIEEPEMFLHPGLQRKLLNFYASLERHTFFMTTHSNHFLDITIDIKDVSIFTFRKLLAETEEDELTPDFSIEAVDSGCESSLELLGVRNSSVFLVNATIWVEGITDRWYLRKMLDSYMAYLLEHDELKMNLEEDTHYSFVEYGGANITHWSFLDYEEKPIEVKRLCAKAIVIIDEDGKKKEQRKEDLEKFLGDRLIILPCREVENLLPYEIIKEVVKEYEKDDELIIKDFAYEKYKNESLGTFIENTMLKKNPKRKGGYKADSGTIKTKVDFCERALPKIQHEHLPETTKEVVKKIYEFICSRNS